MRRKEAADAVRAKMEGKSSAARREMFKRIKRGYTPPVSMMQDPETGAFTSNVTRITQLIEKACSPSWTGTSVAHLLGNDYMT